MMKFFNDKNFFFSAQTSQIEDSDGLTAQKLGNCTCHSCKTKCSNIWELLKHCFVTHGLRISEENLPEFEYPRCESPLLARPQPTSIFSTPISSRPHLTSKNFEF